MVPWNHFDGDVYYYIRETGAKVKTEEFFKIICMIRKHEFLILLLKIAELWCLFPDFCVLPNFNCAAKDYEFSIFNIVLRTFKYHLDSIKGEPFSTIALYWSTEEFMHWKWLKIKHDNDSIVRGRRIVWVILPCLSRNHSNRGFIVETLHRELYRSSQEIRMKSGWSNSTFDGI